VALVAVLVGVTWKYARSTSAILTESGKMRLAAEKQASAAQRSVDLLTSQIQEQLGLGRSVVKSAIESALSAIAYWKQRPLTSVAMAPGLPPSDNLVPANALAAVEQARRISSEAAEQLSSAFDDLRNAVNEIERLRHNTPEARGLGFLETTASHAPQYLDDALRKLQVVKGSL
jgi:hypothetical protein